MITPNGETYPNATVLDASSPPSDERYGSLWQSIPRQWMTDPLWEKPPRPCSIVDDQAAKWLEDDGSGHENGESYAVKYFPLEPFEECIVGVPPGAQPLPAGTGLGCPTVDQVNQGTADYLDLWPAPESGQAFATPWIAKQAMDQNIQSSPPGRFHCEYADPQALCPDDDFVEDAP